MTPFKKHIGNWLELRGGGVQEIDLHVEEARTRRVSYVEVMAETYREALEALKQGQAEGVAKILFVHGRSTSGPGKTTKRSVIRGLMRSPEATPYIVRSACIQHETAFLAVLRSPLAIGDSHPRQNAAMG